MQPRKRKLLVVIPESETQKDIVKTLTNHIFAIQINDISMITHNMEVASLTQSKLITIDQIYIATENESDYQNLHPMVFPSSKKR